MKEQMFFSELFKRFINDSEPEYENKVLAEALYKYYKLREDGCTCKDCFAKKDKLAEFLKEKSKV